jgi:hypothetical protein
MSQFQTYKSDLTKTRIVATDPEATRAALQEGEIMVEIEKFSFTANNVTYGASGDMIGYWQFYPALDNENNEWGIIPVWGFGKVVASHANGIEVGERLYGFFPPCDHAVLTPTRMGPSHFADATPHRVDLPAVYNNYTRLAGEANYDPAGDHVRALLWPLHVTAFCLCDDLEENNYYGAEQVIIVSASSKTALGLAQGLAALDSAPSLVGLTSPRNRAFVESLGCYDSVICYDALEQIDTNLPSVIVDMAGDTHVMGSLHAALGDHMVNCMNVGLTHWESLNANDDPMAAHIIRDRSAMFFAPAHIQRRSAEWGQEGFAARTGAFMAARATQSQDWMHVETVSGFDAFRDVYANVVIGKMKPSEGLIIHP